MQNRSRSLLNAFFSAVYEVIIGALGELARWVIALVLFAVIAIVGLAIYLQVPLLVAAILVALSVMAFVVIGLFSQ